MQAERLIQLKLRDLVLKIRQVGGVIKMKQWRVYHVSKSQGEQLYYKFYERVKQKEEALHFWKMNQLKLRDLVLKIRQVGNVIKTKQWRVCHVSKSQGEQLYYKFYEKVKQEEEAWHFYSIRN